MRIARFVRRLAREVIADDIADVGAMMAFYAVLALFPMLVFVISVALLVIDPDTVREGASFAVRYAPASARDVIIARVETLIEASSGGIAIVGASLALWGASRGSVALMTALNTIHGTPETRSWIKRQAIAVGITLAVTAIIVLALGLLFIGPLLGRLAGDVLGFGAAFDVGWNIARWAGAGLLVMIVWAVLYKFLSNTSVPFHVFTPGAFLGVLLWLGVSALFSAYLTRFDRFEATYGTLGGAIVFLTWLWLSNIAILFGAEVNDVIEDLRREANPASPRLSQPTTQPHAQAS
jgi:membrane protein